MEGGSETPKLKLDIINISQTSQIQFGLRTEDYQRYRQYLTRRLLRVRKALKTSLGKKVYQNKINDPKNVIDARYLLIVLLKTERAWAYAMDLKKQDEQEDAPRKHHHMERRFLKAEKHALQLEKFCVATCDDYTIAEAQAYAASIKAARYTNIQQWVQARDENIVAKAIFELLIEIGDSSLKQIYEKKIEESQTIDRYCQYNLRHAGNIPDPINTNDLISNIKSKLSKNIQNKETSLPMETITWRSKQIKVSEKVRTQMVTYDSIEKEFNKITGDHLKRYPYFDKMIAQLIQIERVIKNDFINIERQNIKSKSVKSEIELENQKTLLSFVVYHKMKYLYERNQILSKIFFRFLNGEKSQEDLSISRKKKKVGVQDLVRIYGDQIKIFTSMVDNRPDTSSSASSLVASKDNEAQLLLLRSYRIYFIGLNLLAAKKWSETNATIEKILSNVQQIKKITKSQDIVKSATDLEDLVNKVKSQIHANAFMEQLSTNEDLKNQMNSLTIQSSEKSKDLLSGIENYDASFLEEKKLVEYPPQLQPTTTKPMFFDLAFNSCEFPSLENRKKAQSKGLFGFWK
ncbi:signal recognition particle 68 kDa subunit [Cavenderia fasciculata]|uniref:Signal recognition particle subunit SRP68 n=1 Tax=Cavenderia fasciculata TaxID=261658 RepID=F4Q492_CACFS|nr:signal recognition particle 68 kDa subunit [Cavenderia fasciculata]EGG17794.1 signal recognition particle 68 kDa subunit [Cavenderia fasciculata]|eukprot:XP_004356278.1 signal recognition particle 68 kDa subunit [Cavenderia fasciculata]